MDFDFEIYEEGEVGRTRDRVHVTLGKDKRIYLSRKAVEALGRPDGVALMFDRRRQVIGVMPSALERKHAYRMRTKKNIGAARVVYAKNFCAHYSINTAETVVFPAAKVDRNGVLILDLQEVKTASRTVNSE